MEKCANCAHETTGIAPYKRCSRCMASIYCCKECQKEHWPTHRSHCQKKPRPIENHPALTNHSVLLTQEIGTTTAGRPFLIELKRKIDKLNTARVSLSLAAIEKLKQWRQQYTHEDGFAGTPSYHRSIIPLMDLKLSLVMSAMHPRILAADQRGEAAWATVLTDLLPKHPTIMVGARGRDAPIAHISFGMDYHTIMFGNAWSERAGQQKVQGYHCEIPLTDTPTIRSIVDLLARQTNNRWFILHGRSMSMQYLD